MEGCNSSFLCSSHRGPDMERRSLTWFSVFQHLRIRCSGGSEFYTRSSTRVRGRLGHRFMFIDGDKAVSGSYR